MKTVHVILAVSFLFLGAGVWAQTSPAHNGAPPAAGGPEVKKGYYSIGNNAAKRPGSALRAVKVDDAYPTVQKGYYSIGNNNRKLSKQILVDSRATSFIPFVTKGYYSIGRNNEQLKQ